MSKFTDALSAFIAADRNYAAADERWRLEQGDGAHLSGVRDAHASTLTQAGDELERELRLMMREEARGQQVRFETYGGGEP